MNLNFVTSNTGKVNEVAIALESIGYEVTQVEQPYPEIQADTLAEVATTAMKWLAGKVQRPFIIEDSGLFIDALSGFPGVYSAYTFKTIWLEGLLKLMENKHNRAAHFESCIGYIDTVGDIYMFHGTCPGHITNEMRGTFGFGFDPIFIPYESEITFAEMDPFEKNQISHRGRAINQLAVQLQRK